MRFNFMCTFVHCTVQQGLCKVKNFCCVRPSFFQLENQEAFKQAKKKKGGKLFSSIKSRGDERILRYVSRLMTKQMHASLWLRLMINVNKKSLFLHLPFDILQHYKCKIKVKDRLFGWFVGPWFSDPVMGRPIFQGLSPLVQGGWAPFYKAVGTPDCLG